MRSESGNFNFAGWYHFVYVIVQSFFVFISLLYFYASIWLWVTLIAYIATTEYFMRLFKKQPHKNIINPQDSALALKKHLPAAGENFAQPPRIIGNTANNFLILETK